MTFLKNTSITFCALLTLVLGFAAANEAAVKSVPDSEAAASAIDSSDWAALYELLLFDSQESAENVSPVHRIVFGHACLATGHNSEAVAMFYASEDKRQTEPLDEYLVWCEQHVTDNCPVSRRYLLGDALARKGRIAEAIEQFDLVLDTDPDYTLALNSRGVTRWIAFRIDSSLTDFEVGCSQDLLAACRSDSHFADGYANQGVMGLVDAIEVDHAMSKFDKAIERDSTFWLAYSGKAMIAGSKGDYARFEKTLREIENRSGSTPFQIFNTGSTQSLDSLDARGYGKYLNAVGNMASAIDLKASISTSGVGVSFDVGSAYKAAGSGLTSLGDKISSFDNPVARVVGAGVRGGVFMFVKGGANLDILEEGVPRTSITWFLLNYPDPGAERGDQ